MPLQLRALEERALPLQFAERPRGSSEDRGSEGDGRRLCPEGLRPGCLSRTSARPPGQAPPPAAALRLLPEEPEARTRPSPSPEPLGVCAAG
ncbi:Hypothetical predicted protein [Marmota monax]|uniref:Uncharacterized protein n=1 Tax=Marmota monax TaxID=9995 RepID=A0A5E4CXI4_MARMO|nr:hypothetical protein GHT09_004869 [Marmota monax]VTJ85662.1 Hypothetical predicted protein [Marmota monax]